MKKFRKFIQEYLFYHTTIDVVDVQTLKSQKATFRVLFGFIQFIKYQ